MANPQILTAQQGDKLDLLLWRDAGLGMADVPRVLAANPGLADRGAVLPTGTPVILPAAPDGGTARVLPLIQLWS